MAQLLTIKVAQLLTIKNGHVFAIFGFLKCAEIPIFIVLFEHQPKFDPKGDTKKTITFDILQNTG